MTHHANKLRQSLERSAQCVHPLELLLQAGTLSQQEKEVLQNANQDF